MKKRNCCCKFCSSANKKHMQMQRAFKKQKMSFGATVPEWGINQPAKEIQIWLLCEACSCTKMKLQQAVKQFFFLFASLCLKGCQLRQLSTNTSPRGFVYNSRP